MQLKMELGDHVMFVDMPESFRDLEAGMLHIEDALRSLLEKNGMITTLEERLKELGHRRGMFSDHLRRKRDE